MEKQIFQRLIRKKIIGKKSNPWSSGRFAPALFIIPYVSSMLIGSVLQGPNIVSSVSAMWLINLFLSKLLFSVNTISFFFHSPILEISYIPMDLYLLLSPTQCPFYIFLLTNLYAFFKSHLLSAKYNTTWEKSREPEIPCH